MIHIKNPAFNTDMPDPDLLRMGDTYYMVSTTMFFMPGAPILKSKDLCHWEIASYVFDTVEDHENYRLENGKHGYGKGQWATSLCYHNGLFYACFVCHDMGKTFIYSTDDIEKSNWKKVVIDEVFHDMSFLFWGGKSYLVYGNGSIEIVELEDDLSGVKKDGLRKLLIETQIEGMGLRAEGCRALVKDNMIYLFFIDWPKGSVRREICYRANSLEGPFERKILMEDTCGREGRGIAQGIMIDTVDGDWYAMLFQDRGASGRIPYLMPAGWEDGWPVLGCKRELDDKRFVPMEMELPFETYVPKDAETLRSNLFGNPSEKGVASLKKCWQWNHNPIEDGYQLSQDGKSIRLITKQLATGLLDARNTLTQRTIEPGCSCKIRLDYSDLKEGDYAGICAFQGKYGQIGIVMQEEETAILLKKKVGESYGVGQIVPDGEAVFEEEYIPVKEDGSKQIWFRIDFDFDVDKDFAYFYCSMDNLHWTAVGEPLQMRFTLDMFVGYRIGLFDYATKEVGGSAVFTDFSMTDI